MLSQAQFAASTPFPWLLLSTGLPTILMSGQKPKETQVLGWWLLITSAFGRWRQEDFKF